MALTVAQLVKRIQRIGNYDQDEAGPNGLASTTRILEIINNKVEQLAQQGRSLSQDFWVARPADITVTANTTVITLAAGFIKTTLIAWKVSGEDDTQFRPLRYLDHKAPAFVAETGYYDILTDETNAKKILLSRDGFGFDIVLRHWYMTDPPHFYAPAFNGSGPDDLSSGGTAASTIATPATFTVQIATTGTPDTFKWKKDTGAFSSNVNITASPQTLSDGVTVTFAQTTGHTVGDEWTVIRTQNDSGSVDGLIMPPHTLVAYVLGDLHALAGRFDLAERKGQEAGDNEDEYLHQVAHIGKARATKMGRFGITGHNPWRW
jgi:hypothetical protein